jgi:hypothetical protein
VRRTVEVVQAAGDDVRPALGVSRRRHDTSMCPTDARPGSATQSARRTKRLKPGKSAGDQLETARGA